MCAMIGKTPRPLVSILVALQALLQAATTHGMSIDLHPQGVLEVQQNATAAVVCKVQHDIGQQAFTVFTWDGQRLFIGDQHFNSGLLSIDFTNCVADEGRICEEFRLTIKGVSAANGSIVGCNSTNHSTEFMADGHVEILVTDSKPGSTSAEPSATHSVTSVISPSLGNTTNAIDMTTDTTPSPTPNRGSATEGVLGMMLMTALLTVIVGHLL